MKAQTQACLRDTSLVSEICNELLYTCKQSRARDTQQCEVQPSHNVIPKMRGTAIAKMKMVTLKPLNKTTYQQITRCSHGSLHVGISLALGPHLSHHVVSSFLHGKKFFPQLFFGLATAERAGPTTPGSAPFTRSLGQVLHSATHAGGKGFARSNDRIVEEFRSTGASVGSLFTVKHHTKTNRVKV